MPGTAYSHPHNPHYLAPVPSGRSTSLTSRSITWRAGTSSAERQSAAVDLVPAGGHQPPETPLASPRRPPRAGPAAGFVEPGRIVLPNESTEVHQSHQDARAAAGPSLRCKELRWWRRPPNTRDDTVVRGSRRDASQTGWVGRVHILIRLITSPWGRSARR